ncbi:MAG: hypothetical protein QMB16_05335 [Paracoccaceae bacterium]|jgi:hypothetical protein
MNKLIASMNAMLVLIYKVAEIALVFVGLIVLIYLLLGKDSGDYTIEVMTNLSLLINAVGSQTLVALAIIFVGYLYFANKKKK